MKKDEVKVGGLYTAQVSDKLVTVRIDSTNSHGGWNATNIATGKRIRIKSAQRLRGAAEGRGKKTEVREEADAAVTHDKKTDEPVEAAAKKAKSKKADAEPKPKRVSALDAAAQVLAKAGKPMSAQDMIAAMAEQKLWSSPAGKTPHATLYAAIIREIRNAVDSGGNVISRFRKVDRGLFEFNAAAKAA